VTPNPGPQLHSDHPPRIVLAAVALLGLLFLAGGVYLFSTGPFTGIEVVAPDELAPVTAAVADYHGSLLGLEGARRRVAAALADAGQAVGEAVTIYPDSPLHMRPIDVRCRVGYLLVMGRQVPGLKAPVRLETLEPGRRLVVRVRGRGNFTGNKAYKAALRFLRPLGLEPADGERYEVKVQRDGADLVEHWVPVR
jgi:hypothetical protein